MIGARKRSLAQPTPEGSISGVLAVVTRQLVRPGKLPAATLPIALVRLLAGVRSQVRL